MGHADEKTRDTLLRAMDFSDINEFKRFLGATCDIRGISEIEYGIIVENSIKDILREPARINKVTYHVDREVLESIVS